MNTPVPSLPSFPSKPRPMARLTPSVRLVPLSDLHRTHRLILTCVALQSLTILGILYLAAS